MCRFWLQKPPEFEICSSLVSWRYSRMQIAIILGVINTVISMIACPIIAGNKNRSVVGWFFGGLFLGLIGLIIYTFI